MEIQHKRTRSSLYFSTFLVFGMTIGMAGPALMDILLIYFSDLDVVSSLAWLLFSQALTRFVGAIAAGVVTDRYQWNYNAILAFCMGSNALLQVAIPLSRELWSLIMLTAFSGLFAGVMDTVTNIALISVHGIEVAPYVQGLYFFYGFGAFISPLIVEPFLSEKTDGHLPAKMALQMDYDTWHNSTPIIISQALDKSPFHRPEYWSRDPNHIEVAFWIVAGLHVPVICGLSLIGLTDKINYFKEHKVIRKRRKTKPKKSTSTSQIYNKGEEEESGEEILSGSDGSLNVAKFEQGTVVLITALTSIVIFLFDGLQGSFGGYIFTYARAINMTSAQGAILTSLFWGFLAVGRLLSIPLAVYFLPSSMLRMSLTFSLIFTALMMFLHSQSKAIWLGTCLFALSMGNVFPCSLAMVEQYFPVTGTIACTFVVSAAIGETVVPLMVGELFDVLGTIMFMGSSVALCSLACISFGALTIVAKRLEKKGFLPKTRVLDDSLS